MSLAALATLTISDEMDAVECAKVGTAVFIRIADGKISCEHIHRLLAASRLFLEASESRALEGGDEWARAASNWKTAVRVLEMDALRLDLNNVRELTDEHRELVLDPSRNTVFNYGSLSGLLKKYRKANPGLRIPNLMGSTLLYAATPGCRHASDGRFSGVGCKHCPGWFCF